MKTLRIALLATVLVGPAMAQSMNIDLTKLPPDVAAAVVKAEQERKAGIQVPTTAEEAEKYATVGKHVAEAISATAKGLSIEANEFVKTPVGWWTFIFVFWYFLGAKLWHIVGGIMFWIVSSSMLWNSMKHFFMQRKVLVAENGKEKKYEYKTYTFRSDEAKTVSAMVHFVTFVAVTITSLLLVF